MTSTNIHIGLSENSRSSSKVLKPPGGGSSDIFGNGNGTTSATPRSNKGHMASNIFAPPMEKTCNDRQGEYRYFFIGDNNYRRNPNMDSHNRLFGEVERPYTPAKNHFKSNIPLGGVADSVDSTPRTNGTNGTNGKVNGTNGHTNGNSNGEAMIANGNSVKHDGNPVTGQGYITEINTAVPALNNPKPAMNGTKQVINKNRIPPGGFSSGLW